MRSSIASVAAVVLLLAVSTSCSVLQDAQQDLKMRVLALDKAPIVRTGVNVLVQPLVGHLTVFGHDLTQPIADLATDVFTKALGKTRGIFGNYMACWKPCTVAGGEKGTPDQPLTCKGACNAFFGPESPMERLKGVAHACKHRDQLSQPVLQVYSQFGSDWCAEVPPSPSP